MTYKEKFIAAMVKRGYEVEELGGIVMLYYEREDAIYTAFHFFKTDGTLDESQDPYWKLERK